MLAPWAFAAVAHQAESDPDCELFYGDEDSCTAGRRHHDPEFKPDWSPIFQRSAGYLGRAVFCDVSRLRQRSGLGLAQLAEYYCNPEAVDLLHVRRASHIRRVLLSKPARRRVPTAARAQGEQVTASPVSIVIPSKNRTRLLSDCLASVAPTLGESSEVIIVDNGSTNPTTRTLYERVRSDQRYRILESPGPFNFSRLCNLGAAASTRSILVFLNNDTQVISRDWLHALVARARDPDVGAVGARLLYPNGRVQHGGLVVGTWGSAGHVDAGASGKDAGYLGKLCSAREISAVTGACLAVERTKFNAVRGFDENLPEDLNDIDFCMRLGRRGWKTVYEPAAVLIHKESATRGRRRDMERYPAAVAYFVGRWGETLHDDPYFSPALCLNAAHTCLM
jgi:GT2 family glycosyltransferase